MKPWERYATQQPASAAGPWTRYQTQPAPQQAQPSAAPRDVSFADKWQAGIRAQGDALVDAGKGLVENRAQMGAQDLDKLSAVLGTYPRWLGGLVGLNDMPTQQELDQLAGTLREFGSLGISGPIGRGAEAVVQPLMRAIGRGGVGRVEAARETAVARQAAENAGFATPAASPASAVLKELTRTAAIGTGIDVAGGWVTGEDIPETASGVAAILMRLPAGTRNLLVSSPRFARWALSSGAKRGGFGSQVGTITALLANEGPDVLTAAKEFDAMAGEQQPQQRTSVGPNAIPPPQWGRRSTSGGVGPPAPQPETRTRRW